MKHIKQFEEIIKIASVPGIGKSTIMKDISKKLGYEVIELKLNITIFELDSRDIKTRKCTGNTINISEEECDILKDKELIFIGLFSNYYYFYDDKEKINNILEITRKAEKYNL